MASRLVSVARCTSVSELEAVVDDVARGLSESEAPMLALVAEAIAEVSGITLRVVLDGVVTSKMVWSRYSKGCLHVVDSVVLFHMCWNS